MSETRPPRIAEHVLQALLPVQAGEALLGDFAEEFHSRAEQNGEGAARRWYWRETLFSTPVLLVNLIQQSGLRRQTVSGSTFFQSGRKTALWGFLFLIPALSIAVPGVLFSFFGYADAFDSLQRSLNFWDLLVHPAVVLGGLALAALINLFSVLKLSVESDEEEIVSIISIKKSAWNLVPLILGGILAAVIFLYLIAENFGPFF